MVFATERTGYTFDHRKIHRNLLPLYRNVPIPTYLEMFLLPYAMNFPFHP